MNMIAVGNIILICNTLDHTKTLLKTFCKLISRGLQRSAIKTEINIFLLFPSGTCCIEPSASPQAQMVWHFGSVWDLPVIYLVHSQSPAYPSEIVEYPPYSSLSIGLALLQTCKCSILPEDRCHIGRSALQTVMTAHQCLFTRVPAAHQRSPRTYPYPHRKNMRISTRFTVTTP